MGQKVNPISNRLGVIRGWDSNWYGGKKYGETLLEDSIIRKFLRSRLAKASVSRIIIERTLKMVTVTICTSRPGMVIGKGGKDVDELKEELKKLTDKEVQINIHEIKRPELDAEGIKIQVSGRLNGAEMARSEMFKEGRTPLHTLRADIDYALAEAITKVGIVGVKVWICRGEVYGKKELTPAYAIGVKEQGGRPQGERRKGGFRNKKNNNR